MALKRRRQQWGAALCALALAGCGLVDAPGTPLIEAHRFAAGNWPENSRTGLAGALDAGYKGLEFDLLLTKDKIPLLSHDAEISPVKCTFADGTDIPASPPLYVKDYTLAELHAQFLCGGKADPAMEGVEVVADTHLTLDEVIAALASHPDVTVHIDVKYEQGKTLPLQDFFDYGIAHWSAARLANPWYVSSSELDFLKKAKEEGVPGRSLTWPKFPAGANSTLTAIGAELATQLGFGTPIGLAQEAGANMLNLTYQVVDRRTVEMANQLGWQIQLWTLDDPKALAEYCTWPVDALISDYPERASCQ
jgi:glycerophosphoryl diester phosphodiesterase